MFISAHALSALAAIEHTVRTDRLRGRIRAQVRCWLTPIGAVEHIGAVSEIVRAAVYTVANEIEDALEFDDDDMLAAMKRNVSIAFAATEVSERAAQALDYAFQDVFELLSGAEFTGYDSAIGAQSVAIGLLDSVLIDIFIPATDCLRGVDNAEAEELELVAA